MLPIIYYLKTSLCVITSRDGIATEEEFLCKIRRIIEGGAKCIQLRDPPDYPTKKTIATALKIQNILRPYGIPLIINNRVDIALAVKAAGVHLGQSDMPVEIARTLLGKQAIIGLTVTNEEEVIKAEKLDVNYLGVQVFPSLQTKPNVEEIWGIEGVQKIQKISTKHLMLIGGIERNLESIPHDILKENSIALIGELWRSKDPHEKTSEIFRYLNRIRPRSHL